MEKDDARGDPNLARVLARHGGCALPEGVEQIRDMVHARLKRFICLASGTPVLCDSLASSDLERTAVQRYINAMLTWIRGNYDWHRAAGRYSSEASRLTATERTSLLYTEHDIDANG
ncbi:hypothetical protein PV682_41975 [Streptomyces niveiscabiei]|uniref:hypothetical protein n=1 Tax=Streptomyces niveiscabiei TaxID=164115 RepID=UPI0029BA468B|nr:hypothetical protein [Streptomyces niveiscabiei]MDX3387965.1 hypothetical protein [Streptomyces niveiscabiei]